MESKLDAVRERVVESIRRDAHKEKAVGFIVSLREFFGTPRVAWGGLAAAWLVIITLNAAARETVSRPAVAPTATAGLSLETRQALREQRTLFAELVGTATDETDAGGSRIRFVPRPRSEHSLQSAAA